MSKENSIYEENIPRMNDLRLREKDVLKKWFKHTDL